MVVDWARIVSYIELREKDAVWPSYRLDVYIVRFKWVTKPKGSKYGYEYVVVCEPRAMDNQESYLEH